MRVPGIVRVKSPVPYPHYVGTTTVRGIDKIRKCFSSVFKATTAVLTKWKVGTLLNNAALWLTGRVAVKTGCNALEGIR